MIPALIRRFLEAKDEAETVAWGNSSPTQGFLFTWQKRPRGSCWWPRWRTAAPSRGGDGTAVRSYTYISDMVDGIYRLMHSDLEGPANTHACGGTGVGNLEYVSVKESVDMLTQVSGKRINVEWVTGPVGVQSRNLRRGPLRLHPAWVWQRG